MPNKARTKWKRPFSWPPSTWEFTPGLQVVADGLTAVLLLLAITTVGVALVAWPILLYRAIFAVSSGTFEEVRNILLAVGALVGVPFLVWRTLIASRQTDINRQSHYTALFTKAVEQLGADKTVKRREFKKQFQYDEVTKKTSLDKNNQPIAAYDASGRPLGEYQSYEVTEVNYEVRLGAIYALERIAQDSKRDSWPIYLTLGAYIQNNSARALREGVSEVERKNSSDIDEAFNVICRFKKPDQITSLLHFDEIHLSARRFSEGSLESILFSKCTGSSFSITCGIDDILFRECILSSLDLRDVKGSELTITDSKIDKVHIYECELKEFAVLSPQSMSLSITNSRILGGSSEVSLEMSAINLYISKFEHVLFQDLDRPLYASISVKIDGNIFQNCHFFRCDFSFLNLSENQFENCEFDTCNLVQTVGISENNEFRNCFSDDKVKVDPAAPISVYDIQMQWNTWKHKPLEIN